MDFEGFQEIFGKPNWPQFEPFGVHTFVADLHLVEGRYELMLEVLSLDEKTASPGTFVGTREEVEAVYGGVAIEELEGQWRTMRLTRGRARGGPFISIHASLGDQEGVPYAISTMRATPNLVVAQQAVSAGTPASTQDIEDFLSVCAFRSDMSLGVLDVGQGAAAILYEKQGSCLMPLLYLDIGGGCGFNAGTFPMNGVRWCFTQEPGILLTHWHWDHWAGATYGGAANTSGPLQATWLVPSTPPGPFGKQFAERIVRAGGRVMHWPAGHAPVTKGRLTVGEATGKGWNDSGLALLAELETGRRSLVAGDAAYVFLPPALQPCSLKTLLIAHHGGSLDAMPPAAIPRPDGGSDCYAFCSVGDKNSYGHPSILTAYLAAGWNIVGTDARLMRTPARHIDADTGGLAGGLVSPCCSGRFCSLVLAT